MELQDEVCSVGRNFVNPLTDASWTIYDHDHDHATKVSQFLSTTTDQIFQSTESTCLEHVTIMVQCEVQRVPHVASFVQQAQAQQGYVTSGFGCYTHACGAQLLLQELE